MSNANPRRFGRLVLLSFLVVLLAFAALVIWLVTAPVREIKSRQPRPAAAPAGQPAPSPQGR